MLSSRIAMSRNGRWVVIPTGANLDLIDLLGTARRRRLATMSGGTNGGGTHVAFVGPELWMLHDRRIARFSPATLEPVAGDVELAAAGARILPGYSAAAHDAAVLGDSAQRVSVRDASVTVEDIRLAEREDVIAVHGHRILAYDRKVLRALDRGRNEMWRTRAVAGELLAANVILGGKAIVVLARGPAGGSIDHALTLRSSGAMIHHVDIPRVEQWAVAEEQGHAFAIGADGRLSRIDLRYARVIETVSPPIPVRELAVDQDGRYLVLVGADRDDDMLHVVVGSMFRNARPAEAEDGFASAAAHDDAQPPDAAEGEAPVVEPVEPAAAVAVPDLVPLAFGPLPAGPPHAGADDSPYQSARDHLDALLDVVAARTALAIADAWNSGRLSASNVTSRPYEIEVSALLGESGGFATEQLAETKARVEQKQREASERARASAARGMRLPFPELAREVGFSAVGAQVLLVTAAPALRGEITRLYGVLSNDPHRPVVDRFLIEQIVAGGRSTLRDQIARELAPDAPLVRHGLIEVDTGSSSSLFARLTVPDALLDRLRGLGLARTDDTSRMRGTEGTSLDDLYIPDAVKRDLVHALAEARTPTDPLRLVLRGRRGSGRHALVAAMAARVGRELVEIDTARMPRAPKELVPALRAALFRASVHGVIPVVSGLELFDAADQDLLERVRQVMRVHPGPVVVRASPEGMLPLDPGFVSITLPALGESARVGAWQHLLARAGLTANAEVLANRYRIAPGIIRRVIDRVRSRGAITGGAPRRPATDPHDARGAGRSDDPSSGTAGDATAVLDEQVRQHVATRLDHVASRIARLASWEDVALPEEMLDSLREFIARSRFRRTVYDTWGYDKKISTARGLTALFYGPPGTGKTMVAGVIARELGLDMYRVDLARVVSKWLGETEKNLAEVFDAAEDGQVLILFDEADSLFAKRTDVKTSNDRYANLEVNYLLQRLDSFEGVAVLTSNLDGAIDPAFKRRLSLRLQFPFPDEEVRLRLWAAHVTPQTPTSSDFDFGDLARRFPLSGGYIRNCAIRAAFLAAHEGTPLSQKHLLRAIQLEYRELGKLSTSSRME